MTLMLGLIEQLKIDEGYEQFVYKCPAGFNTIGFGYNLDANPLHLSSIEINHYFRTGMPEIEAERLLILMINLCIKDLKNFFICWENICKARQDALINMAFNLGLTRFLKFKKFIAFIEAGDFSSASKEGLNSLWAKQLPNRSKRLMAVVKKGQY